jgi:acetyltransferase-like isoleucine patch superfamily enzyme
MSKLLKNPLTIWLNRLIKATILEHKYKKLHLKIGYMSRIVNCEFGLFNTIYDYVNLTQVTLKDFTYIMDNCSIAKTEIGKFCSIGPGCNIGLGKHPSDTFISTHPIFFSNQEQCQVSFADKSYFNEYGDIHINNDVWLGANVTVVDGITIGNGAIVATGSVVTKDIPPYAIVGGVPAKIIKYRFSQDEIYRLLDLKWWDFDIDYLQKNHLLFHNISYLNKLEHKK